MEELKRSRLDWCSLSHSGDDEEISALIDLLSTDIHSCYRRKTSLPVCTSHQE